MSVLVEEQFVLQGELNNHPPLVLVESKMLEKKVGKDKQRTLAYFGVALLVFSVTVAIMSDLASTSPPTQPNETTPAPPGNSLPPSNVLLQVMGFFAVPIAAMAIVAFVFRKMAQGK